MDSFKLIDDAQLSGVRITSDGYMTAQVACARTGIQEYSGRELRLDTDQMIRAWRPESEVFDETSMASYAGKPATDDHPDDSVNASNWREHGRGNIGTKIVRNGDHVEVPLILMDSDLIEKVQAGKRELSMGYRANFDFTPGITPDGEPYDAVQRNLRMNHIAVVDKGRAGSSVRIGDSWSTFSDRKPPIENLTMTTKTIVVDGLTVETTDAAEKAIVKLQGQISTANDALVTAKAEHETALSTAQATHDTALAAKDAELAAKDTKIAELEKQVITGDALDALVADRAELMGKAKAFTKDADLSGKTKTQIKAMAVDSARGENFTEGKSEAYIDAAFDMLEVPDEKPDEYRNIVSSITPQKVDAVSDRGYEERCKNLESAYKKAGVAS